MAQNNQELLTPEDVARILKITSYTVRRKAREGTIPNFIKIGQGWRITRADLQKWLDEQKVK
jgi:excisionase family DNA binding protein